MMKISQNGERRRFFAERRKVEAQEGNPIHDGVTGPTRRRIMREFISRSSYSDSHGNLLEVMDWVVADLKRIFGRPPSGGAMFIKGDLQGEAEKSSLQDFLQMLEICADRVAQFRMHPESDLEVIQSLLADDLSAYRLVNVGTVKAPKLQAMPIDNEHLHAVITDRTFELTRIAGFASSQTDYADAWKHYSRGDMDDALTNAHKAVESACKAVIKKADPTSSPENLKLSALVTLLVKLDVIPSKLEHVAGQLRAIFENSGTLRNEAGTAHGSLDLTTPEANVALLGLRMSGTLISFLAEQWQRMSAA